jgi:ubiquinone/menaquinone biosynthesis C-methylase UbiE
MTDTSVQIEAQAIRDLVELAGQRVLEVGCGSGRISADLAPSAGWYLGIDPDAAAIAQAALAVPAAIFQIGSGEALPFADASFDLVLFTLSLHHQNPVLALHEAARVLRSPGYVLVIEPVATSAAQQVFNLFDDETEVLAVAQAAIATSPFNLITQREVAAVWELADAAALLRYSFDPEIADPVRKEQVLRAHLGASMDACPILLTDTLTYTLLQK